MDISKIRKKALSRETDQRAEEPRESGPLAEEKKEETGNREMPVIAGPEVQPSEDKVMEKKTEALFKPGPAEGEDPILELLTFSIASEEFAFRLSEVEEIIRYQVITRVPCLPDYVLGITSLRGKIIPVIDLQQRLVLRGQAAEKSGNEEGPEAKEEDRLKDKRKIIIISGPKGVIGASIEKVMGVVRFPKSDLLDPPSHLVEEERKYIEGVAIIEKRFISIVRAEEALNIAGNYKEDMCAKNWN